MAEETGGLGLVKVEGMEERDKMEVGQLTCLFEAVHSLSMRKFMKFLPALSCFVKGKRERQDKTSGEKRLVCILMNWGWREET